MELFFFVLLLTHISSRDIPIITEDLQIAEMQVNKSFDTLSHSSEKKIPLDALFLFLPTLFRFHMNVARETKTVSICHFWFFSSHS
jgi:hypothetical protein